MPIHDWPRTRIGFFRDFHHGWISTIHAQLNRGVLPSDYYAMAALKSGGFGPHLSALGSLSTGSRGPNIRERKSSTLVVRHEKNDAVVAVIEVLSPAEKSSDRKFDAMVNKARRLLAARIHLLVIDLFPPTVRDPNGFHAALWDYYREDDDTPFVLPDDARLTCVSYDAGDPITAYIEPIAVGRPVPEMPLFLLSGIHVMVPLDASYQAAWAGVPWQVKRHVEPPAA